MEMVDFVLGFAGIDLCGDDGRDLGRWPWQSDEDVNAMQTAFRWMRPRLGPAHAERAPRTVATRPEPPRPSPASSSGERPKRDIRELVP